MTGTMRIDCRASRGTRTAFSGWKPHAHGEGGNRVDDQSAVRRPIAQRLKIRTRGTRMKSELRNCTPAGPSEGKDHLGGEPVNRERLAAAERMRQYRIRRQMGLHCVTVLLNENDIDVLICKGFLHEDRRRNHCALEHGLSRFICQALGPPKQQ